LKLWNPGTLEPWNLETLEQKYPAMKIQLYVLCFFLPVCLFSQVMEWTPAVALTDSVTDNRNAIVTGLVFYEGWDHYVFWEKSAGTAATQIYAMSYYSQENTVALTEGDHHHINPCFLEVDWVYPPDTTLFYLCYLSNEDGDFDIYYRTYTANGLSAPILFLNTSTDENHLRSNGATGLTWESDGRIMYSRLIYSSGGSYTFTEAVAVDSLNCKNPVLEPIPEGTAGESYLAWEKVIGDSSKVMLSEWNYFQEEWTAPEIIYDTGHCTNIRFEESTFSSVSPTLSWDKIDASGHRKIISYDPWDQSYFYVDASPVNIFDPAVFNIFVGVKDIWFFALLSFVMEDGGQTDIYGGFQTSWYPEAYQNLSVSTVNESNPQLWNGYFLDHYQDVINIWESERNGYRQLWTSKILVPISGSVNEKGKIKHGSLEVFPNPFSDRLTVSYKSVVPGKGKLQLTDVHGRPAGIPKEVDIKNGQNEWQLDLNDFSVSMIPSGIYLLSLEFNGILISSRIIKFD
jgi:hypothetical protein